jgi:hypothetical protein
MFSQVFQFRSALCKECKMVSLAFQLSPVGKMCTYSRNPTSAPTLDVLPNRQNQHLAQFYMYSIYIICILGDHN